jgi:hypothetical protein
MKGEKMTYSTPSIISLGSFHINFLKNQATCTLNGAQLVTDMDIGQCFVDDADQNQFCLSGLEDQSGQLDGLFLGFSQSGLLQITTCTSVIEPTCVGQARRYTCTLSGDPTNFNCLLEIRCPDGTVLTTCEDPGPNCFSRG